VGFTIGTSAGKQLTAVDEAVGKAFKAHKGRAGSPCLTQDIHALGFAVSERTVGRSLSKHDLPIAKNLLSRQFAVEKPNAVWVGDITFVRTVEGWLYLATMIDLFNRQVVGWQVSSKIDQALVNDALNAALINRGKPKGVMIHTDRGSQYCAKTFKKIIKDQHLVQSMSRKGNCWDNAVATKLLCYI
jgi:putative transposase